jgi:hypothetical protein
VEEGPAGCFNCFPISGQDYEGNAFKLDDKAPDFPATGLTKTSYIHHDRFYSLVVSSFKKRKGMLQGQLLVRFLKVAGLARLAPNRKP